MLPVGEAPEISPNYLGPVLFDYVGFNHSTYFNYLNEIRTLMPVISRRFYKTEGGNYTETLSDKERAILDEYRILQYYMLFDKKVN